jgi:hypothetical protein
MRGWLRFGANWSSTLGVHRYELEAVILTIAKDSSLIFTSFEVYNEILTNTCNSDARILVQVPAVALTLKPKSEFRPSGN